MFTRHLLSALTISSIVAAALMTGAASATLIDFNEFEDSAQLDNPGIAGTDWGFTATGGVADSGYFNFFAETFPSYRTLAGQTFDLSTVGASYTVSLDFRNTRSSLNSGFAGVRVGFSTAAAGTAGQAMGAVIQAANGSPDPNKLQLRADLGGTTNAANVNFTASTWYRVVATITHTGMLNDVATANAGTVDVALYALDALGDPTLLSSTSRNAVDADFADTSLYAGFYLDQRNFAGFRNVDNFQVVPEPASLALLALGSAFMLRRRGRAS